MASLDSTNWGLKTSWHQPQELHQLINILKPGDLIEIRRGNGLIRHWGIFYGNEEYESISTPVVIHAGSTNVNSGTLTSALASMDKESRGVGSVAMEPLIIVWGENSEARINNSLDHLHTVLPVEAILKRALNRVENQVEYNLIVNNCEHFVKWCRYGIRESGQITTTLLTGFTTVCTALAICVAGGLHYFMLVRSQMDMDEDFDIFTDSIVDDSEESDGESRKKKRVERSISLD